MKVGEFNVVIKTSPYQERDLHTLFGDEDVIFKDVTDLPRLLADLGIFKSTTQARKAGHSGELPLGWSVLGTKKKRVFLWNPSE